jgi:TrmH family RNA methyltransferase
MMLTIKSPSNPHIREALAIREKRRKYRHEAFLIEGFRLTEMALRSGASLKKVFLSEEYAGKREGMSLSRRLSRAGVEVYLINNRLLALISDTETPQGVIAVASYKLCGLDDLMPTPVPFIIVADGVQDPGNLGTIIRTSDAAGADALIILPGTCDAFMPKVIRATAGSIFNLPVVYSDPHALLKWLGERSIIVLVTDVNATLSIFHADLARPLAIVFGNEARGVSEEISRGAEALVRVPLLGRAESLNVASSAAVCLYETVRQRSANASSGHAPSLSAKYPVHVPAGGHRTGKPDKS